MRSIKSSIILSIKLASEASAIIEKLIWISFAILGSTYFGYLLLSQVESWDEHSVMTNKGYESISNVDYPAVTFCTRSNTKYAIMERIGNTLGLDSEFTKKHILPLRNDIIEDDMNEYSANPKLYYNNECLGNNREKENEPCKVIKDTVKVSLVAVFYLVKCTSKVPKNDSIRG